MGPVSRWAVNRPWQAIITWAVLLVVILGLTATIMGKLNDSFSLPNTDSTRAANLLASEFGSETSNASVQILFRNTSGTIADKQTEADIKALTKQVEALPSVASVQSPY
ncbi:MAG: hypothetical protein WBB77_12345, partial [Candidatus Nanopelagicales bacterium]